MNWLTNEWMGLYDGARRRILMSDFACSIFFSLVFLLFVSFCLSFFLSGSFFFLFQYVSLSFFCEMLIYYYIIPNFKKCFAVIVIVVVIFLFFVYPFQLLVRFILSIDVSILTTVFKLLIFIIL